jgi:tetratricopeptide (TPR) repeat protein
MSSSLPLSKKAIDAALSHEWKDAVTLNESILDLDPNNVEAMLRLAYAHNQLQNIEKAKKIYRKVLAIDKYNYVAIKHINKLNALPKRGKKNADKDGRVQKKLSPILFLEEPGKTKTINLINVAPVSVLSQLEIGDAVSLNPKKHSLEVRDENKVYLGALPDDLAFRLLRLIQSGNNYSVIIKNTEKKTLSVFIREEKRGKRFQSQPSFLPVNPDTEPKESKKPQVADDEFSEV